MQFQAIRTISIVDTIKNVTPDTEEEIEQKNLLRLAKQQSIGVARKVKNLIQGFVDGKLKPEVFTSMLLGPSHPALAPLLFFIKASGIVMILNKSFSAYSVLS